MKSIIIISIAVFVMAAGVFGFTSNVSADYNTPGTPTNSELFDQGDPLGRGPRGGRNGVDAPGDGLLHDELISAFSEAVGVPVAEIETRIEAGGDSGRYRSLKGIHHYRVPCDNGFHS